MDQQMDSLYINRELSLLEFHKRVLAQAFDPELPLLERLRFLCISCTNLDEFFEIRVAGLKQRLEIGAPAQGPEKISAQEVFDMVHAEVEVMDIDYGRRRVTLATHCKVGDTVEGGQALVVLEAMKMQNELAAGVAGKVTHVPVAVGQSVNPGDILVVIEPEPGG